MPTKELTMKQSEILAFIEKNIIERGFPPTNGEIGKAFNFRSRQAARVHLEALQRKGYIRIEPGKARGIKLLKKDFSMKMGMALTSCSARSAASIRPSYEETLRSMAIIARGVSRASR